MSGNCYPLSVPFHSTARQVGMSSATTLLGFATNRNMQAKRTLQLRVPLEAYYWEKSEENQLEPKTAYPYLHRKLKSPKASVL